MIPPHRFLACHYSQKSYRLYKNQLLRTCRNPALLSKTISPVFYSRFKFTTQSETANNLSQISDNLQRNVNEDAWNKLNWGDYVLLKCINSTHQFLLRLVKNQEFCTHFGSVSHNDIKERGYGDVVTFERSNVGKKESAVILRATFQDIVVRAKRKCTPVYPKDMAQLAMLLDLKEVLEAGSGSGFLSLFLSKCVGQSGEVWSFEIREDFHKEAKKNADYWNPNHKIKFFLGDVATCNSTIPFDAVVLDMLEPWTIIESATRLLRLGGPLVCILPNVTQVINLQTAVKDLKLPLIFDTMEEVLCRKWECNLPTFHPEFRSHTHTTFLLRYKRTKQYIEMHHQKERKFKEVKHKQSRTNDDEIKPQKT